VALEARVGDPRDVVVVLQELRDGHRVLAVAFHPHREGLQALDGLPGVEGRLLVAHVAQAAGDAGVGEPARAERLVEVDAVVGGVLLGDFGELLGVFAPGEAPSVDEDAAHRRPVAVDPLRRGVPDDVGAVFERPAQRRRRERVVHEQRDAVVVSDVGQPFDVRRDERRIADGLEVDVGGVVVDGFLVGLVVQRVDEAGFDAVARRGVGEVGVGATVQRRRRNDVVTRVGEQEGGEVERRHPGGGGDGTDAAFECGDALLQDVVRRVHQPRVDVARLLQGELRSGVLRVLKDVRGGLVDRWRASVRVRLRCLLSDVQGVRLESALWVAHCTIYTVHASSLNYPRRRPSVPRVADTGQYSDELRTGSAGKGRC